MIFRKLLVEFERLWTVGVKRQTCEKGRDRGQIGFLLVSPVSLSYLVNEGSTGSEETAVARTRGSGSTRRG